MQDERIYRYIRNDPLKSLETLEDRYQKLQGGRSPDGREAWLNWAVRLKREAAYIGRVEATVKDGAAYLAYELSPPYWGSGYAKEGCGAVIEHLFKNDVSKILAEVDTRNSASIRLLERLGFEKIGFQAEADVFRGNSSDEYTYRLRAQDYIPAKNVL